MNKDSKMAKHLRATTNTSAIPHVIDLTQIKVEPEEVSPDIITTNYPCDFSQIDLAAKELKAEAITDYLEVFKEAKDNSKNEGVEILCITNSSKFNEISVKGKQIKEAIELKSREKLKSLKKNQEIFGNSKGSVMEQQSTTSVCDLPKILDEKVAVGTSQSITKGTPVKKILRENYKMILRPRIKRAYSQEKKERKNVLKDKCTSSKKGRSRKNILTRLSDSDMQSTVNNKSELKILVPRLENLLLGYLKKDLNKCELINYKKKPYELRKSIQTRKCNSERHTSQKSFNKRLCNMINILWNPVVYIERLVNVK